MRLLIDWEGMAQFVRKTQKSVSGETRRYYAARHALAILVCRNGLDLTRLCERVMDASTGWDRGDVEFVLLPRNAGKRHSKVTIRKTVAGSEYDTTLSALVRDAPQGESQNERG